MKKQIKVSMEGRNTIRVFGERLVGGNKWSRFLEDFQVPENGEMNLARAKFHGGILTITVPREKVGKEFVRGGTEPQNLSGDQEMKFVQDGNQEQSVPRKGLNEASPAVGFNLSAEEKSLQPLKASAEPNNKHDLENIVSQTGKKEGTDRESADPTSAHDRDGDQRGRSFTPLRNISSKNDVKNESRDTKEKHVASERPEDITKEKVHKESMRSSELPEAKKQKLEKNGATDIPEKHRDNKELYGASKKKKHKKEMKGLNEERQLLVNMGTAMLAMVALTAYVTYNFVYVKDKN